MVAIKDIQLANASLRKTHDSLTGVFAGATSGIGLETLRAFAKHIPKPRAIIVGRNRSKFQPQLDQLHTLNPDGEYTFIEAEISLLANIDRACDEIKRNVSSIDFLVLSQGYVHIGARDNNADGLDNSSSLRYYGRVRFTQNLLPIMSPTARVVSVLAGGKEGKVFLDDLDLERNYSTINVMEQFTTLMTLSFDKLAQQNPKKSFIHAYPGFVNTGTTGRHNKGLTGWAIGCVEAAVGWFIIQPQETGERMLYYATNEQYSTGSWSVDWDGTPKTTKALAGYREQGLAEKVEEHTQAIFQRVLAK